MSSFDKHLIPFRSIFVVNMRPRGAAYRTERRRTEMEYMLEIFDVRIELACLVTVIYKLFLLFRFLK